MAHNLIIAHRGESYDAPENTLAAINLAWERKVEAVEIDIQLTIDNEIVVIHDKNTMRTTGKKKIVRKSSFKELKLLNAGFYKDGNWANEPIPTLSEVLESVPSNGKLIIEIKSNDSILPKLASVLTQSKLMDSQIELIAYNALTLSRAKKLMPQYNMLWLLDLDYILPKWLVWKNARRIIKKVKKLNLDGVDVWAGKILNKNFISNFKDAGLLVYSFTINNPVKAKTLMDDGIDGITTDRAYWMSEQLKLNSN